MGLWINLLPREHFASVDTITWLGHHTGKRVSSKTWMPGSNGFFNEQLLIHYNHRILRSFATVAELSHYGAKWLNDWDDFGLWKSDVQLVTAKNLITWRGRDEARVHHFKLRRTSCGGNVIDNNKKAFGGKNIIWPARDDVDFFHWENSSIDDDDDVDAARSLPALGSKQLFSDAPVELSGAEADDVAKVADEAIGELLVGDLVLEVIKRL